MQLGLNVRDAGTYPGVVVLGSIHDVRVVALEFAAGLKDDRAILEFACAARGSVAQEIPLVNGGDRSMVVKAAVTGPDAFAFVGVGRDIVVAKGRRDAFPLAFKPSRPGAFHATLTLRTSGSGNGDVGESRRVHAQGLRGSPRGGVHDGDPRRRQGGLPQVVRGAERLRARQQIRGVRGGVRPGLRRRRADVRGAEKRRRVLRDGPRAASLGRVPRRRALLRRGGARAVVRARGARRARSAGENRARQNRRRTRRRRHHRRRPERPFRRHRLDVASSRSRARRHDGASDIGQPAGRAGGSPRGARGTDFSARRR